MTLGRTREYLKSRKNRRDPNTVKIITAFKCQAYPACP